jgi:hypothetical protein
MNAIPLHKLIFYFYFFSQIKQLPYDSCGIPRQILVSTLSFPTIVDEMQ